MYLHIIKRFLQMNYVAISNSECVTHSLDFIKFQGREVKSTSRQTIFTNT